MNATSFFCGIFMITFAASGLYFLKFFRSSGDRFFAYFSAACGLLAVERLALFYLDQPFASTPNSQTEVESIIYGFRLLAFLLILYAIIDKNRRTHV